VTQPATNLHADSSNVVTVKATDANGYAIVGAAVTFAVSAGSALMSLRRLPPLSTRSAPRHAPGDGRVHPYGFGRPYAESEPTRRWPCGSIRGEILFV
jgi:hypothetical protein